MTTTPIKDRAPWLQDIARDLPPLLTVEQVAAVVHAHPKTVRKWIRARALHAVQGAGSSHYIISRCAVLDWLAARSTQ